MLGLLLLLWLYRSLLLFKEILGSLCVMAVHDSSTLDKGPFQRSFTFTGLLGNFVDELLLLRFELKSRVHVRVFIAL